MRSFLPLIIITGLTVATWAGTASAFTFPETATVTPLELPAPAMRTPMLPEGIRGDAFLSARTALPGNWNARFDTVTGNPVEIYGSGIQLPAGPEAAANLLLGIVARDPGLLGRTVLPTDLELTVNTEIDGMGYVLFEQRYMGLPVVGARVQARTLAGRMPFFGIETVDDIQLIPHARVSAQAVTERLRSQVDDVTIIDGPLLVVLPGPEGSGADARLAWQVEVRVPLGEFWQIQWIDATDGTLLRVEELLRHVSGTVSALHDERKPGDPLIESPMPFLRVVSDQGTSVLADEFGGFDTNDGAATAELRVDGRNVTVTNLGGGDATFTTAGGDVLWTNADAHLAELDTYVFADRARVYARGLSTSVSWLTGGSINANVNIDDTCNAYFDGDINFFRAGGGCANTGRIADVVYHEFGHGFHYFSIVSGSFDSAASEGFSDYMACTMTNDAAMAPGFFNNGGPMRRCDLDRRWPEDIQNDPHGTGMIISGALWDLRTALIAKHGYEDGVRATDQVFARLLRSSTDIPSTWIEALLADDTDGNLDNGTPNVCEINEAWTAHGIGPAGGAGGVRFEHKPLGLQTGTDEAYELEATLKIDFPQCAGIEVGETLIHWRNGRADVQETAAVVDGNKIIGAIPAQDANSRMFYRIEIRDTDGGDSFWLPDSTGTEQWYFFRVGPATEIWCDNFEDGPGEWTHRLTRGEDNEGADDWQWGVPNGQGGDPSSAFSGDNVWGNDLGNDNFNGLYQPDKTNYLRSPSIDTTGFFDVHLVYRRWLNVEDSMFDQARIYINGNEVWLNDSDDEGGERTHMDRHWYLHDIDVSEFADDRGNVGMRFEIETDGGAQFGGWTMDDVCLYSYTPPPEDELSGAGCQDCNSSVTGRHSQGGTWLIAALGMLAGCLRRRR